VFASIPGEQAVEDDTRPEQNKRVYRRYIELLNAQDFGSLSEVVDPDRYGRSASASRPVGSTSPTPSPP
jgi:hypothetical protein